MGIIFYNGRILTLAAPFYAQAVLVEDGRIVSVGSEAQIRALAKPDDEWYDLNGKTLAPAFLDAHSHFSGYANSLMQIPLERAESFEDICAAIQNFVSTQAPGEGAWIVAKGYDHNRLREHRHPSLELLDKACPDHPLVVQHQSGHMGCVNSRALELLGIRPDTPAPEGGVIGLEGGKLTGYMEENAFIQALMKVPAPTAQDFLNAVQRAQERYASYGITTVQEGMLPSSALPYYDLILSREALWLDVVGYADVREREQVYAHFKQQDGAYHGHFRLGGCKMFLDGSPQGKTAWLRTPYVGGGCGYPVLTDEQVYGFVKDAVEHRCQLLTHCNGDAAAAQLLRAYSLVCAEHPFARDLRPVMIHAQLVGLDQLPLLRECGMMPSFFVAHVYHWGDTHLKNLGPERAAKISPARSALQEGLPVTFHQDSPVIEPDMLETVWCAAVRRTREGVFLGKEERITVEEALRAVTAEAAYQYGEEHLKGTIEAGKVADLIVLDKDPLAMEPDEVRNIRVCATFKDGRVVFEAE